MFKFIKSMLLVLSLAFSFSFAPVAKASDCDPKPQLVLVAVSRPVYQLVWTGWGYAYVFAGYQTSLEWRIVYK